MEWESAKCWQPRQLVLLPRALYTAGWQYLGIHRSPGLARFIARLEAVTVHAPVMPEPLIQVNPSCLLLF
jgi:hypothetical protein